MQGAEPVQERQVGLTYAQQRGLSERRACYLLAIVRSTARYCPALDQEAELIDAVALPASLAAIRSNDGFGI